MKYTIETTENGCVETLEFADGSKFTKRSVRAKGGCRGLEHDFAAQLEENGFCEEITNKVYDLFDGFMSLDFLELAKLEDDGAEDELDNYDSEEWETLF